MIYKLVTLTQMLMWGNTEVRDSLSNNQLIILVGCLTIDSEANTCHL
jgi:hypothetical protein